jgi:hypothetical protein
MDSTVSSTTRTSMSSGVMAASVGSAMFGM